MSEYQDNVQGEQNNSLHAKVSELPKELSPERDLWPGIEQAINELPQQSHQDRDLNWSVVGKVAASFAPVALVLGLWLTPQFGGQPNGDSGVFNPMAASFDIQKRQLLIKVSDKQPVVENWQQSLAELEQAEQALIKALQSQPEDPALMKMLSQVYQQQLELIQKAHKPEIASKFSQI
ncbi:MAG: hypothetical protein HWE10_12800 [Gammaproteobacteria bacterium]|nr:hypothetical protein [Gammaproteobacteria bacterium]